MYHLGYDPQNVSTVAVYVPEGGIPEVTLPSGETFTSGCKGLFPGGRWPHLGAAPAATVAPWRPAPAAALRPAPGTPPLPAASYSPPPSPTYSPPPVYYTPVRLPPRRPRNRRLAAKRNVGKTVATGVLITAGTAILVAVIQAWGAKRGD